MLNRERLLLAIDIHARSYKLLRWIGTALDKGQIPIERAEPHSDSPEAAVEWIARNYNMFPQDVHPDRRYVREFANFFWTYVTSTFDVVAQPGILMHPGILECMCPLCARITQASHLQPKKLTKIDKLRAIELMADRVSSLAKEEGAVVALDRCLEIVHDPLTRRHAGFSTYGYWLIQRLSGRTDGPAILALWRQIAWNALGSPIQGFALRYEDFERAELLLLQVIRDASK